MYSLTKRFSKVRQRYRKNILRRFFFFFFFFFGDKFPKEDLWLTKRGLK